MAEDIRQSMSDIHPDLEKKLAAEITAEALRQSESCLYMSTQLYIWLRRVRRQHKAILLAPIVLTGLAGFSYVQTWLPAWGVALMAFLSTLIPSLADALDIQTHVTELKTVAGEWKALQDRFRQLAKVTSLGPADQAQAELRELTDRLDVARSSSITPPEKYYELARKKIKNGDYDFTVDIALRDAISSNGAKPMSQAL
jgi:hypothetical protein